MHTLNQLYYKKTIWNEHNKIYYNDVQKVVIAILKYNYV